MKTIPLTQCQCAIVDDAGYEHLSQWTWKARWSKCTQRYYAVRSTGNPKRTILMHREILGLEYGDKRQCDHREPTQTLNNQRSNLRISTRAENNRNRGKHRNNTSGFKGVSYYKAGGTWQAQITVDYKKIHLGTRSTPQEALRTIQGRRCEVSRGLCIHRRTGGEMTIQEAFEQAQELLGNGATVNIECSMRESGKPNVCRWIFSNELPNRCVSSYRSWEHALAIAKSGNEDCWPEADDEYEVSA